MNKTAWFHSIRIINEELHLLSSKKIFVSICQGFYYKILILSDKMNIPDRVVVFVVAVAEIMIGLRFFIIKFFCKFSVDTKWILLRSRRCATAKISFSFKPFSTFTFELVQNATNSTFLLFIFLSNSRIFLNSEDAGIKAQPTRSNYINFSVARFFFNEHRTHHTSRSWFLLSRTFFIHNCLFIFSICFCHLFYHCRASLLVFCSFQAVRVHDAADKLLLCFCWRELMIVIAISLITTDFLIQM